MASRRKKKATQAHRERKKTAIPKKDIKSKDEVVEVPSWKAYAVHGTLLTFLIIINFIFIASDNLFMTILTFFGMLYFMQKLVYIYVLRKRLSGGSPEQKSRF